MNAAGLQLIKNAEGFRSKPYLCPAGIPTIGYGSTYYENRKSVSLKDAPISEARATELLMFCVKDAEKSITRLVKSNINENQHSALCSFVYNLGASKFAMSTLLKRVNANPDDKDIHVQFMKWKYGSVKGVMVILPGLVKRRIAESLLYFTQ